MSVTSLEIRDKVFSTKFRGYDKDQVDEFLDKILCDYEELIRYKDESEDYIKKLEESLSAFTNDFPKRQVTNEQKQETMNDSVFY